MICAWRQDEESAIGPQGAKMRALDAKIVSLYIFRVTGAMLQLTQGVISLLSPWSRNSHIILG
jgi:hypothetical protein